MKKKSLEPEYFMLLQKNLLKILFLKEAS